MSKNQMSKNQMSKNYIKPSIAPSGKNLKAFDSATISHLISGLCAGAILPIFKNPIMIIIVLNIYHGLSEWYEVLYKNQDEDFDKIMINKYTDTAAFMIGIIVSGIITILYLNQKNRLTEIYIKYFIPIFLTIIFYMLYDELSSSAEYIGIPRYGKYTKHIKHTIFVLMAICLTITTLNIKPMPNNVS